MVPVVRVLSMGMLLLASACSRAPATEAALCDGRERCTLARKRAVDAHPELTVADLRLAHAPGATEDEDRCDRREYWLLRPDGATLLAADCEQQWGADNLGPAETRLVGERFLVKYEEFQSNDVCETFEGSVRLSTGAVEKQERWTGTVEKNRCTVGARLTEPIPKGAGARDKPLLSMRSH